MMRLFEVLRVFVDDFAALVNGKIKLVSEMAKKVMKKLKEEIEKKGLKLSVNETGKEGKSKMIASCRFQENELSQFSKEERVTLADSVETLGVRLENKSQEVGSERKSDKKNVQIEVLDYQEE